MEPGSFYLGGEVDPASGDRGEPLIYEADDLVTHGVIVGMTGSGKTGLGIDLLEEALLAKVPCLIIDPKGDMGNLRLLFPEFTATDFAPWVDPAEAQRQGVTIDELGAKTATTWKEGLAGWDIEGDRLQRLLDAAEVTIFTPGSASGVPLDILGSLDAPDLSWDGHAEDLRDEIEGFVSSLLVLAGIEADPVSSPSHILLATIIEGEWREGRNLDLARLVGMIAEPPFRKLGVFELDSFFPKKDRTALAMKLNGLLASPSFAAWMEGEPLDIERLLEGGDKTKAPIIYLAHLAETERQFVVTLLLAKVVTWMRRQSGTGKLRALIYMDEMYGFCPPVAEPPAKKQFLTILKQARAFGVGMVLATQNPVDLDYKAMSNAGTWMVGRLQTENDKKRILEGLADAGGATDVGSIDTLISNLDKRQFVLRRAGQPEPTVFGTRWAMSYLAGPLDRTRVEALTEAKIPTPEPAETGREPGSGPGEAAGAQEPASSVAPDPATEPAASAEPAPEAPTPLSDDTVPVAPQPAASVVVGHLDPAAPWAAEVAAVPGGKRWKAIAVATVHLLYDDRPAGVSHQEDYEAVIDPPGERFDPEAVKPVDHDARDFLPGAPAEGAFILVDAPIDSASYWKSLATDLRDHLVRQQRITIWKNESLKIYSRVGETKEEFHTRCGEAAEDAADAAVAKLKDRFAARIDRVRDQISRADRRVAELNEDLSARRQNEVLSGVGDILGSLLGGRSKSGALTRASSRRSQTRRTRADVDAAADKLAEEQQELADLEAELADELAEIGDEWDARASDMTAVEIPPESSDVRVGELQLIWVPVD